MNSELLKFCRYYKGEKDPPRGVDRDLWLYEKKWAEAISAEDPIIDTMIEEYTIVDLGSFNDMDGVPLTLKALLFNRYCHWNSGSPFDCVDGFKEYYRTQYLNEKES